MSDALLAASDNDFCYLTTRGRVTGRPHEIEIWFALDGTTLFMLSGAAERSDWVRNLIAAHAVRVRLGASTYDGTARVVDPDTEDDERARRLVFEKYQPRYEDSLASWRERSLPVAIELAQS